MGKGLSGVTIHYDYFNHTKPKLPWSLPFRSFLFEILRSVAFFAYEVTIAQVRIGPGGNVDHPSSPRRKTIRICFILKPGTRKF